MIGLAWCFKLANDIYGPGHQNLVLLLFLPYLFLLFVLVKVFLYLTNIDNYFRGGSGEDLIAKELFKLPETYCVFRSVHVNNNRSDIDFVVLGPKGILTIEVKSHSGQITFNGHQLLKNNLLITEKDILKQAKQEAGSLAEYLRSYGFDGYIKPIIVFSHWRAKVAFGLRPVDKIVYVVQKFWLIKLIYSLPDVSYRVPQSVLEQILSKLVEAKK
jgi:hypothetical protein